MTQWKAAGPAQKDTDDALWKRFRSAQDAFFSARDAANTQLDQEYADNAEVQRAGPSDPGKLSPVRGPQGGAGRARVDARGGP